MEPHSIIAVCVDSYTNNLCAKLDSRQGIETFVARPPYRSKNQTCKSSAFQQYEPRRHTGKRP